MVTALANPPRASRPMVLTLREPEYQPQRASVRFSWNYEEP
jgi:hypothetical protein